MSYVTGTFAAVANFSLTYNGETPSVRNYNQLDPQVRGADCPMRLLLMTTGMEGDDGHFIAIGKFTKIAWKITDRLLIKPVAQGTWADVMPYIPLYFDNYITAFQTNRRIGNQTALVGCRFLPSVISWAGIDFFGVDVILTIEDYIT